MERFKELFGKMIARFYAVLRSKKGQGLVEYGLLLVLIAVVVFLMLKGTGSTVNSIYSRINSGLGQ